MVKVRTLERCFEERIDRAMGNITGSIKNWIQNAIRTTFAPKVVLAVRSRNSSSGRDATSVMMNSEHGEHIGIAGFFGNVSDRENTLHALKTNDETRDIFPEEVGELSVPEAHVERQPHTHHIHRN